MISTKRIETSETTRCSRLSHLLWALAFLLVSSTFSVTTAGQSSDRSSPPEAERIPSPPSEPLPNPHPLPCKQKNECGRACGTKYLDKNGDGIRDANEPALCGWTIILNNGQGSAQTTTTDTSGGYCFDQVQPGTYTLGELSKTGWVQTSPLSPGQHTLNIKAGQTAERLDFGNQLCETCCSPGFALDFDGKDDHVEVVNTSLINNIDTGDFTLEAWVNGLESDQGSHPPIMQNRPNSNAGFFFGFHNKWNGSANMIPFIRLGNVNWVVYPNQPNLLNGDWHHFAVTKNDDTLTYFADGLLVGSFKDVNIKNASIAAVQSLMIGWDPLTSAFDGMIDNLCIWSVARTQCDIQTDMVALPAATTPGLVACWAMDEGLGQVTGDFVAGQSGILGSTPTTDNSDPVWVGANH